jgi:hypothetical protein
VSRGGRPDLAWDALEQVHAPTLLIVGGRDAVVIGLNQQAYERLNAEKQLVIIPGATYLFEESWSWKRWPGWGSSGLGAIWSHSPRKARDGVWMAT